MASQITFTIKNDTLYDLYVDSANIGCNVGGFMNGVYPPGIIEAGTVGLCAAYCDSDVRGVDAYIRYWIMDESSQFSPVNSGSYIKAHVVVKMDGHNSFESSWGAGPRDVYYHFDMLNDPPNSTTPECDYRLTRENVGSEE